MKKNAIKAKVYFEPVTVSLIKEDGIRIAIFLEKGSGSFWKNYVNFIVIATDRRAINILNRLQFYITVEEDGLKIYKSNLTIEGAAQFLTNRKNPIEIEKIA